MIVHGDSIKWPCDLPALFKEKLLETAIYKQGVTSLQFTDRYAYIPGLFYILQGSVGMCFSTLDMKSVVGGVVGQGDWLGAYSIEREQKYFGITEEIETLSMLLFPRDKILQLAQEDPLVYKFLFFAGQQTQSIWMQALLSSIHTREQKLVYTLLELRARYSSVTGAVDCLNVTQYQLSTITGISRPRLNETLKQIEAKGFISLQRNKIFIVNCRGLCQIIASMNLMMRDPRQKTRLSLGALI